MAEPFLAEIRMMSFNFPPKGWAVCGGQTMPINQNQGLFSLLGTTYGGDGRVNFALPNLQGRVPIHTGGQGNHALGETGGAAAVTLSIAQMPTHVHFAQATSAAGNAFVPTNNLLAKVEGVDAYQQATNLGGMSPSTIANTGGSQAHTNLQPFLTINFCIALQGIFPSQN